MFLLFGPPGIGKSTICQQLGFLDLETMSREDRVKFVEDNKNLKIVVGAADINPNVISGLDYIVLRMDESEYAVRRKERDAEKPLKANQPIFKVSDFDLDSKNPNVKSVSYVDVGQTIDSIRKDIFRIVMESCKDYN